MDNQTALCNPPLSAGVIYIKVFLSLQHESLLYRRLRELPMISYLGVGETEIQIKLIQSRDTEDEPSWLDVQCSRGYVSVGLKRWSVENKSIISISVRLGLGRSIIDDVGSKGGRTVLKRGNAGSPAVGP